MCEVLLAGRVCVWGTTSREGKCVGVLLAGRVCVWGTASREGMCVGYC